MNLGKEKLERDALNRIMWDEKLNPGDFSIRYVDRASGEMKEVDFTDIELEGDFFKYGDSLIPMHSFGLKVQLLNNNGYSTYKYLH